MRPIKFRAWTPSGRMVDWDELMGFHLHTVFKMCQPDMILMQFTGIKDKNGNDIYEGDIVKSEITDQKEYDLGNYVYGVIEFHKNGSFYEKYTHQHGTPRVYWEKIDSDNSVVVGNIYKNPEMLEVNNANT